MRWQRAAQAVIAILVIGFIAVLVITLRKERVTPAPEAPPPRLDVKSVVETPGGIDSRYTDAAGRVLFAVKATRHLLYADGRNVLSGDIQITTTRNGKNLIVKADDGEFMSEAGDLAWAKFRGNVSLTADGGTEVRAEAADYAKKDGIVSIPGPVQFTKGRMRGSGIGATYDQNRDVLWILDQAKIAVAPGGEGQGGLDAVAARAGLARGEHYLVLDGAARIEGEGRVLQADMITIRLSDDDERVRMLELRGQSRITASQGGPQDMSARDINLTYAEDGRTLQAAKLAGNAVLQLPGTGGAGKRITGDGIELTMGPDGSTVTSVAATGNVQVDLPADGEGPAQRIRSATLAADGAPGAGLQHATFGGGVEYRETRAARKGVTAMDRTAQSRTLILDTAPGLGALQKADFRGNVEFRDAPDVRASAQRGIYHVTGGRLELTAADGEPGPASPRVTDGKISVAARTIQLALSTRGLTAETTVRSTILPQKAKSQGAETTRIPSMLAQDKEVNVTSDRLTYEGTGAAYSGSVTLWQDKTTIKGAEILIDETSGNLTASGGATTFFIFEETDRKTGVKKPVESTGKAETFTYNEAKRLAAYEGQAQINGAQGNVAGDRILLFLKPDGNELERAEAYGEDGSVVVKLGRRVSKGDHLTYMAVDDTYTMTGTPVEVIEEKQGTCSITLGASVTFSRTSDTAAVKGNGTFPHTGKTLPACPAELKR